ncbi:ABC transporter permease [Flindersiella endophytica]
MLGIWSSEWVKLRSVRSTFFILVAIAAIMLFATWMAYNGSRIWDDLDAAQRARFQAGPLEQAALPAIQFCLAVLGVLAMSSEYGSGQIRASVVAVPSRIRLLAGKTPIVALAGLLVGTASLFGIFAIARAIVGDRPMSPGYGTPSVDELPMLLMSGVTVMVFALLGLALGTLLRSTAGAIVVLAGMAFVLPTIATFLPSPWYERIQSILLPNLAGQIVDYRLAVGELSPSAAVAVLVAYLVVVGGAATFTFVRRDV